MFNEDVEKRPGIKPMVLVVRNANNKEEMRKVVAAVYTNYFRDEEEDTKERRADALDTIQGRYSDFPLSCSGLGSSPKREEEKRKHKGSKPLSQHEGGESMSKTVTETMSTDEGGSGEGVRKSETVTMLRL